MKEKSATKKWNNIRLQEEENVIKEYHPGLRMLHFSMLILLLPTFGLVLLAWPVMAWMRQQDRWAVTNKRVLARLGVFNKRAFTINLEKITDIEVQRPFLAGALQTGRVLINTAGTSAKELTIYRQGDPDAVSDDIREAMDGSLTIDRD